MKLLQFFVLIWLFIDVAFLFPALYDACRTVDTSLPLYPLIQIFPYVFIVVVGVLPVYFVFKEK